MSGTKGLGTVVAAIASTAYLGSGKQNRINASVLAVATALLKQRDVTRLQTLRLVLGIEVFLCLVSLVIDFFQYPSVLAFNLMQVIVLSLWLIYFYVSERVRHVFVAHDWPGSS